MHDLLQRQLRRQGLRAGELPDREQWNAVLDSVSRAYAQSDKDRYLLERSLEISSEEMRTLYEDLRTASASELAIERDRLRAALKAADAANRAKSTFLASVSHEIRTPLNGVLGNAELALLADLPETARARIDRILNSGRHLLSIINDILDAAKLEARGLQLQSASFSLPNLISDAVAIFSGVIEAKGIEFSVNVQPCSPGSLIGDELRIRQIVCNLLGNALKFTERGVITIQASTVRRADERADLIIEVQDTGIGIASEVQAHIFEQFTQADSTTTKQYGGTGLGLAICKQLVTLMGGTIAVESEPGSGSRFWFSVPLAVGPVDLAVPSSIATPEMPAHLGLHILLVEDNPVNRLLASEMLQHLGCEISIAENGEQACRSMESARFDLVLMDWQMPVMDGVDATRQIRALEVAHKLPRTPVVALTGNALDSDRSACIAAGMDDFISKPFSLSDLHVVLRKFTMAGARTTTAVGEIQAAQLRQA